MVRFRADSGQGGVYVLIRPLWGLKQLEIKLGFMVYGWLRACQGEKPVAGCMEMMTDFLQTVVILPAPSVEYILTDFGKNLSPILEDLCVWGKIWVSFYSACRYAIFFSNPSSLKLI